MITFWWKHRKASRERVQAAGEALEDAQARDEETSRIVRPIREAQERNMFSEMIRDALRVGYGKEEGDGPGAHVAG